MFGDADVCIWGAFFNEVICSFVRSNEGEVGT